MASLREIRRRIRSIQSTRQIMRAMQLVSGSKFKRAQSRLGQGRQMLEFLDGLLQRVLAATASSRAAKRGKAHPALTHPLTQQRDGLPDALVVITSDAGLAGPYNNNLIMLAEAELRKDTAKRTQVTFIGKRGARYFAKRGVRAQDAYLDLAGRPDLAKITPIGQKLMQRFLAGEIGAVKLLYAKFISPAVSKPVIKPWLPIALADAPKAQAAPKWVKGKYITYPPEYIFEPSAEAVLTDLLPRWTMATFQLAVLEAFTSEHGARMIAMKNATDNAQGLLTTLTMQRNRIRQAAITKELSEIVGTVEALK
jgi:F-type H+-transporting ATPase subunit gamma